MARDCVTVERIAQGIGYILQQLIVKARFKVSIQKLQHCKKTGAAIDTAVSESARNASGGPTNEDSII